MLNVSSVEQIRRKRSVRLNGMAFLVCRGWREEYSRSMCLSVHHGFGVEVGGDISPSVVKETLTSTKATLVEECELLNLMVG